MRPTAAAILAPFLAAALSSAQIPTAPIPHNTPDLTLHSPDPHTSALVQARQLIDQNQLHAAEARLRDLLAANPPNPATIPATTPDAHYLLAFVLFREHRLTDSLAESTTAARFRSPTAAELLVVASDYILLKAYPQAEHWLRYALSLTPADPHLWYLLGRTQYSQDHAADAAQSFQQCLRLASPNPALPNLPSATDTVRAEYNLGLAEENLQHPDLARAAYTRAIADQASQPLKDPQPFLDLAILDLAQQHPAEALPLLEQATRLSPHNALAFEKLGLALDTLNRSTDAIRAFETAITLAPNAERPHFFLGRTLRRLGRTADANAQFHLAQELLGTHSDTATPNLDQQP